MSLLEVVDPREDVAVTVTDAWARLNFERTSWLDKALETRRYVTASSTSDTEVGTLAWSNKTTIPKLTQIADNLSSFYMAALMPTDDWFRWEGIDAESHQKANLIEQYMQTKIRMGNFRQELEKIVRDWVIYGNAFAGVKWVREVTKSARTGEEIVNYIGPKIFRISPLDVVIDPRAKTFNNSIFVYRKMMPLASFMSKYPEATGQIQELRDPATDTIDWYKETGFNIDGFSSFGEYLNSGYIEILEYWGDIFIKETGEVLKNRKIVIADRTFIVENEENPAWSGKKPFVHNGWRKLPDNLYGQGPLDNLVGMQYRVDHLENLKADTFDQTVHPIVELRGDNVEDFEWGPGAKVFTGADGQLIIHRPDSTVLQVNNEILLYHNFMEQMAGSPKESMGFRTPGEKTAFEVNILQQGADRMFQDKLNSFEEHVIEPLLNLMFEMTIRNLDITDVARVFNDDTRALELTTITREDVVADGILRPVGAKHFAARNKRVQEIQNLLAVSDNPGIAPHISGLRTAKALEEELGFEKYNLVEQDIAIKEQFMTQLTVQQLQQEFAQAPPAEGEAPPPEENEEEVV